MMETIPPKPAPVDVAPAQMDIHAQLVAISLQHQCDVQEARPPAEEMVSMYHSSRVPPITVWDYMRRIAKYAGCSPECFVIVAILLDRYSKSTGMSISPRNVHRLCITAIMVSAKLWDDVYYSNSYYASIGGIATRELNALEVDFLEKIHWEGWIGTEDFENCKSVLEATYGHCLPQQL